MALNTLTENLVFPFVLDDNDQQAAQSMVYRPWGTRTIRLEVSTHTDMPRLWMRPRHILPKETALGIYKAYADDNPCFHLTWGGGHEDGPCVKAKDRLSAFEACAPLLAGETSYLFFNLTHAVDELPAEALVTFSTFERLEQNKAWTTRDRASLAIKIIAPPGMPPANEIIRIVPSPQNDGWIASPGKYLPMYDSRWWPSSEVRYQQSEPPPIILQIENGRLNIDWDTPGNTIAVIEDYTTPSALLQGEALGFECFAFDEWSVALRLWFFWVDKYHGPAAFIGRHEIPDVERFDMIIRRKDGHVLLAATDLHWREVWARVIPGKILQATLGMPRKVAIELAKERWSEAWNEIWARARRHDQSRQEVQAFNNPVDPYIRRLAEREATVTVKAGGTEAHVPTLHNVEQRRPPVMTSSDVRIG